MSNPVKEWRKQQKNKHLLGAVGNIVSWTRVFVAPPNFQKETPYIVCLVELSTHERVYGQLVDFVEKNLKIGQKVCAILRRSGTVDHEDVISYGIKFRPKI